MVVAMKAVYKMHSDCIKLFEDLDKSLNGFKSLYNHVVTFGLGNSMVSSRFVADGLTRLYSRPGNNTDFLGVNICFYDVNDPQFVEPILVAAKISYEPDTMEPAEKLKRCWDPWFAFLEWAPTRSYYEAMTINRPSKRGTIEEITVAAVPLFNITSLESALALIDIVGRPS
jgi:hypothetical protein